MEVEMRIRGLMMDPVTNMPIVVLKDVGSDQVLPIWVGIYEANAIALEIEKGGELISIDSRPSDALALALRVDCPIFVEEQVLRSSKIATSLVEGKVSNDEMRRWLENLGDEDLGHYKM